MKNGQGKQHNRDRLLYLKKSPPPNEDALSSGDQFGLPIWKPEVRNSNVRYSTDFADFGTKRVFFVR